MAVVAQGSFGAPTTQSRIAYMRYVGQGHEIPVPLPARPLGEDDVPQIRAAYDAEYTRFYDRPVPGSDVEIMSYAVLVATAPQDEIPAHRSPATSRFFVPEPGRRAPRECARDGDRRGSSWAVYDRATPLSPARRSMGPPS